MNGYLIISEVSEKWEIKVRRINTLCLEGQIDGLSSLVTLGKFRGMWRKRKMKE